MTEPGAEPRPAKRRFDALPEGAGPGTVLQHGARRPDWNAGAVVPPIYQTVTYHYPAPVSEAAERGDLHVYSRYTNPTVQDAAELVRTLEGGEAAALFASGMGATSTALWALLRPGDRVVALEGMYGGTTRLLSELVAPWGVRVDWVDDRRAADPDAVVPEGTRLVLIESPSNPCLRVHDIAAWAGAAHARGAQLFVDSTFGTPINQNPLALGADLVMHSATKYLGGHADLLGGALVGPRPILDRIADAHAVLGAAIDPFAAFLLTRGLRTLDVRVRRQNESGRLLADWLRGHPSVRRVNYPGSASPEQERIAARQMRGRGGVLSFTVAGGRPAARRVLEALRLVHAASSLGGVESLASLPVETSHVHAAPELLERCGIEPGMVRLSVGLEDVDDLRRDLDQALRAAASASGPVSL